MRQATDDTGPTHADGPQRPCASSAQGPSLRTWESKPLCSWPTRHEPVLVVEEPLKTSSLHLSMPVPRRSDYMLCSLLLPAVLAAALLACTMRQQHLGACQNCATLYLNFRPRGTCLRQGRKTKDASRSVTCAAACLGWVSMSSGSGLVPRATQCLEGHWVKMRPGAAVMAHPRRRMGVGCHRPGPSAARRVVRSPECLQQPCGKIVWQQKKNTKTVDSNQSMGNQISGTANDFGCSDAACCHVLEPDSERACVKMLLVRVSKSLPLRALTQPGVGRDRTRRGRLRVPRPALAWDRLEKGVGWLE